MPLLHLGDFHLGAVLGVGTVGTIYDGTVRDDASISPAAEILKDLPLAIKKLHPAVSSDELIQARFRREMLILERLKHPNIIGYYGGGNQDGQLFYVMERVDGGTIKELIESSGALAWPLVVDVGRQVSSALQAAHNFGVIHRDLKPGNLFLTRDAAVKLGDFGIARDLNSSELTSQGLTVGTHAYMAPEQITGEQSISGKVDLYALGCCLFEMLTGRKVFLGDHFAQLFEQHLHVAPPKVLSLVGDVPPELDEIVDQCLSKSPEDRPFNARSVQAAMLRIGEKYQLSSASHGGEESSPIPVISRMEETDGGEDAPLTSTSDLPTLHDPNDVAAENLTEKGRQLLEQKILARVGGLPREQTSWTRVLIMLILIALVILWAMILN